MALGTPGHLWQPTAQGKSPHAKTAMERASKVVAATALTASAPVAVAWANLARCPAASPDESTIPPDVIPPLKTGRVR